jgi:hypothetical protein
MTTLIFFPADSRRKGAQMYAKKRSVFSFPQNLNSLNSLTPLMFQKKINLRFQHEGHLAMKGMKVLFRRFTSTPFAPSAVYFSQLPQYFKKLQLFFPLIPAEKKR